MTCGLAKIAGGWRKKKGDHKRPWYKEVNREQEKNNKCRKQVQERKVYLKMKSLFITDTVMTVGTSLYY